MKTSNLSLISLAVVGALGGGCAVDDVGPDVGTTMQGITCPAATTLNAVTSGDVTFDSTQREVLVPMSPAPALDRSILLVSVSERETSPRYGNIQCGLVAADTTAMTPAGMRCKRESPGDDFTPATPITVHWTVATFDAGVTVQRGELDTSTTNPLTATLSPAVDPTKSFVVLGGVWAGGGGWGNNDFTQARLLDGSTLQLQQNAPGALVTWQVVTVQGASVQRGTASMAAGATTASSTLTVPAGSFAIATYTSDNPASAVASSLMLETSLGASSINFSRGASGTAMEIAWEVVTPPWPVQQFTSTFAAGQATATQTVTGMTAANSIALSTSQGILGNGAGSTAYSDPTGLDLLGEASATIVPGAGSVTLTRASTTSTASITWTAINVDDGCPKVPTLTTNASSYAAAAPITVTFTQMGGSPYDWISIAAVGASDMQYSAWTYTGGGSSGQVTFQTTLPAGMYEARAYFDWLGTQSYTVRARSTVFAVGAPATVTTNAASYATGTPVIVSYTGLPGTANDKITIAVPGSAPGSSVASMPTPGTPSGQVTFTNLPTGTYVARSFGNNAATATAESAQFSVGNVVSTDKATYLTFENIVVSYTGLPPDATNWIAIAQSGTPDTSYIQWRYTMASASGQVTFSGLPAGSYEARVFLHNGFQKAGSVSFTVGAPPPATIMTGKSTYVANEPITATYSNSPSATYDWVGLYVAGTADTAFLSYRFVNPPGNGTVTFGNGLPPGSYEARLYSDNTYTVLVTTTFTVTP